APLRINQVIGWEAPRTPFLLGELCAATQRNEIEAVAFKVWQYELILFRVDVDREDSEVLSPNLLEHLLQRRVFATARPAERIPEIEKHDFAPIIGERNIFLIAVVFEREILGRFGLRVPESPDVS